MLGKDRELPRPIWTTPNVHLGYTDSVFSLEMSALSFGAPERVRFAYRLLGLQDTWIETSRNFASYANLNGGNYTYEVKARNRFGRWSAPIELPIEIDPPPWKTWWAYTLYAAALVAIIVSYLRYQEKRVQTLRQANRLQAVERDLELTGAVQEGFLPEANEYQNPRMSLSGFYRPAESCSGDWWYYEREDGLGQHAILVGDVTGHGPGPAMVTAAASTAFRVQGRNRVSPIDRLAAMNQEVIAVSGGRYQMTMTVMEFNERTGDFRLHNAGGLPAIQQKADGKTVVLAAAGTPLGNRDFKAGSRSGRLEPGERIIVLTDGIPEMVTRDGRMLGLRKFARIFASTQGAPAAEATTRMVAEADSLRSGPQDDDWTFALLERSSGP